MGKELKTLDAQATLPVAMAQAFANDAGRGMEEADKDSYAIPFLAILQGLSPQIESVEGARPGMICNTITNELFKEVLVIPCYYQRRFLRWASRENGGGLKGEYSAFEIESGKVQGVARDAMGRLLIDGDELKDTRSHFVLFQSANGTWSPALLSLSSTQIKKSKRWMSLIQGLEIALPDGSKVNPPSFSHIYRLTTAKEENSKGSWYGVNFALHGVVQDAQLYAKARALHASVAAGDVQVQKPENDEPAPF